MSLIDDVITSIDAVKQTTEEVAALTAAGKRQVGSLAMAASSGVPVATPWAETIRRRGDRFHREPRFTLLKKANIIYPRATDHVHPRPPQQEKEQGVCVCGFRSVSS